MAFGPDRARCRAYQAGEVAGVGHGQRRQRRILLGAVRRNQVGDGGIGLKRDWHFFKGPLSFVIGHLSLATCDLRRLVGRSSLGGFGGAGLSTQAATPRWISRLAMSGMSGSSTSPVSPNSQSSVNLIFIARSIA